MKPVVIIVDDDNDFLTAMVYHFSEQFEFISFDKASEAIKALENGTHANVILSDEKMPEISGVDFLKFCSKKFPKINRIMMTGQMNDEELFKCINEAGLFGFIKKNPANDTFSENFIAKINEAYMDNIKNQKFNEKVVDKANEFNEKVATARIHYIDGLCERFGYPVSTPASFKKALEQVTPADKTSWADAQLFDSSHDELMIKEFNNVLNHNLSLMTTMTLLFDDKQTQLHLEDELNLLKAKDTLTEYNSLYIIKKLARYCGIKSKISIEHDEESIHIELCMEPFGGSILNVSCDRKTETIIKNVLLFHIVGSLEILKGKFKFSYNENQVTGSMVFPISKSLAGS